MQIIPIVVLGIVIVLIAIRKIGNVTLQMWQIMLGGAIAVLLMRQISPIDAAESINVDVMLFLFGMFIVGEALEESGYLSYLSNRLFRRAKSTDSLILLILFGLGLASAFLMNDTLAIIGTPVVLILARNHRVPAKLLLLTLAFAITIGSVMSPIGNPQNLLVAVNGNMMNPFVQFSVYLMVPTVINLFLAYLLLKLFYRKDFHTDSHVVPEEPIRDKELAKLCKISLILIFASVSAKIVSVFFNFPFDFRLTYIALISALPIVLFSPHRVNIVKHVDWRTLIFFGAMFVMMESVWLTGFFQSLITQFNINITALPMIFVVSIILSQFISNVPLVTLYLPLLVEAGAKTQQLVALAAGSTIAGNFFILGAASNVIIIQNAERRNGETLTSLEFAKVGIPLMITNALIYWLFISIV
ncbi:MAG TPA: SLC13 family permease [Acidobacteriota bacterium]|nr:SLC13 family permease [Acidobacteriota bacterium]